MNTALKAAGSKSPLDLGRAISAVGEHIIAGVARVQQPIQLLAVVHGRIGHRIMPDQYSDPCVVWDGYAWVNVCPYSYYYY